MNTIHEIKEQKSAKYNELIKECGMFFAFDNKQFAENKTPLQEGEKYISLGSGAYMPKSNLDKWQKDSKAIDKWYGATIKQSKQQDNEILYELRNYECFYTNDIEDAYNVLKDRYSLDEVRSVFNKHFDKELQY